MGWMPRHPHGPSRQASAWSGRLRSTVVSRGFSAPAVVNKDLLSGFERPSPGSLFDFLLVRGALGRGSRAYSSAG